MDQDADTSTSTEQPNATPPAPEAASTPPTPATASEPSAPGAPAAPAETAPQKAPEPPKTRREAIERAVKAASNPQPGKTLREQMIEKGVLRPAGEQPRAPDGKFAPAAPQAAPAAKAPAAPALAALALPKALKAELGGAWSKADRTLQEAFTKYIDDAGKGIEKYRTAAQAGEALLAEFKPYEATLRAEGATPQTAMRSLLNTAYVLRTGTPAQKAMLVAQTMQQFGVPVETLAAVLQGGQPAAGQAGGADPRYTQLAAQVQELSQQLAGRETQHYVSVAEAFGKTKPHWDLLKPHVAAILSRGEIEGAEHMSETEILEAAYNRAASQYPVISQAQAEAQRQAALKAERDKANAAAAAARAASVQVTGAPGGAAAPAFDPKDRRSVLKHAMANVAR